MRSSTSVKFELQAVLENRPIAMELVSGLIAQVPDADRAFRNEMLTAFGEAFNNVVTHGYPGRSDGMLVVEAEIDSGAMTLHLRDTGLPVDLESVALPDLESFPESGMGIFMIHAMVDEVTYRGGSPNQLTLTKRMGSSKPGSPAK